MIRRIPGSIADALPAIVTFFAVRYWAQRALVLVVIAFVGLVALFG